MENATGCSFKSGYILFLAIIVFGLVSFTSAEERSRKIDDDSVNAMIGKAEPLIEEITGMKFKERIKFKLVKREVVRDVLAEELLPQFKNLLKGSNDDEIARQVETSAHDVSQSLLGKYSLIKKEFLIVPDNIESLIKNFDIKDEDWQDFVFLVVAHEMVHALDDQYFELLNKETAMDNAEGMQAFGALVEGHAVYVTNKIAERLKLSDTVNTAKEVSLKSVGGGIYIKGSGFVEAIINKKGLAGVAEAFASPPVSTRQIMNPEEYFNPLTAVAFDCSKLLEKVAGTLPTEGMQTQSTSLGTMTLSAMLIADGIPEKEANAVADDCLNGAVVIAVKQTLKPKMMTVIALNFASREGAVKFFELSKKTDQSTEAQFNAQLNSSCTVVKEEELRPDGFSPVLFRHVEKKVNEATTTELTAEGLADTLYVAVTFVNMQTETPEEKMSEIFKSLSKERSNML